MRHCLVVLLFLVPYPAVADLTRDDAWGTAGISAYRGAASGMRTQNANRAVVPLDEQQKRWLRPDFGDLVDEVRVVWGATMLGEYSWGDKKIRPQGFDTVGQAFCNRIYIHPAYIAGSTPQMMILAHEMVHARQCRDEGADIDKFAYQYFSQYSRVDYSYPDIPLEVEAFGYGNAFGPWPCKAALVGLKTSGGRFLKAQGAGGGELAADATVIGPWEKFRIVDLDCGELRNGDIVNVATRHGYYLVAQDGGGTTLRANAEVAAAWERFTLIIHNGPTLVNGSVISLKASNGQHYVCAENGGDSTVVANRTAVGAWEKFTVKLNPW